MDESSIDFHGNGERAVPAATPTPSDKKHLLSIFIDFSPLTVKRNDHYLWQTKQPSFSVETLDVLPVSSR